MYCTNAYFGLHPLLNLKVEIPLLCLAQRPSQSFGVAYLLCMLVYLDKTADTHDPRAHQSLLCPPVQAPNSVKGG